MNDLMSGGIHRVWKDDDRLAVASRARRFGSRRRRRHRRHRLARHPRRAARSHAVICDINPPRCSPSAAAAAERGLRDRIAFVDGNAEALPFPDELFDAYTIAFGIRNVTHIDTALREAYRVLKPGGRFLCLEFSKVATRFSRRSTTPGPSTSSPRSAKLVTNDRASYQYLVESIRRFPPQKKFADMIEAARFTQVKWRDLSAGIAAMHSGWKF